MISIVRRIVMLSSIAMLWIAGSASAAVPSARDVLDAALLEARADQKTVLVHFGASWCVWCLRLDAVLDGDEFGRLFHDNYVIAHLTILESDDKKDLENPGAERMAEDAVGDIGGLPFYMFFDRDGTLMATSLAMPQGGNIGHPVSAEEIEAFVGLLEKTAPRMTAADRERIASYLSKQQF
jgi:thiol-disulfide isomerase/thioredoxin